jgi:hypothetical protein
MFNTEFSRVFTIECIYMEWLKRAGSSGSLGTSLRPFPSSADAVECNIVVSVTVDGSRGLLKPAWRHLGHAQLPVPEYFYHYSQYDLWDVTDGIKMVCCAAINCSNTDKKEKRVEGVTFHQFPLSKTELCKRWTMNTWQFLSDFTLVWLTIMIRLNCIVMQSVHANSYRDVKHQPLPKIS